MNEKAIQDAYEMFKSGGYNGSIDDYKQLISTNGNALNDSYEIFKGGGYNKDINSFKTLMGLKKKSDWGSTLGSGSSASQKTERKATKEIAKTKDLRNVADKGSEIFTGYPGKEKNQYEFSNGNWYELNPEVEKTIKKSKESYVPVGGLGESYGGGMFVNPSGEGQDFATPGTSKNSLDAIKNVPKKRIIEDDARVKALNKQFGKNASLDADYETFGDYDNSPEKKDNKYRIKNNSWERLVPGATEWSSIENEGSIGALNRRYGQNIDVKKAIVVKPKEIDPFLKINTNFLAQSEESAQQMLEKNFKGMGFTFEQTGVGTDYITVTPNNGEKPMTFSFDEKSSNEAVKLQSYLRINASAEKEDDLSAVNKIKNNTSSKKEFNLDIKSAIENNKYYDSEDYKNAFKELTFQQKREEIKRRRSENANLSTTAGTGLAGKLATSIFGEDEKYYENEKTLKKFENKLNSSEEYKLFVSEQKKYDEQIEEKYGKLYDELSIAKQIGNKEAIKTAKAKIEGGYSKDLIGDNLNHMTDTQYDLQRDINNFNKRKEKLQLDAKNGNLTEEQYNDAVEGLSSEAQRLDVAAKNVAATQKKMNVLAGIYATEKAKSGGFFGNFTNAFVVAMDEVREPLSYIVPVLGKDLSGEEEKKIATEAQIITPQQRQYYKDKGYNEQEIKNIFLNNAQKNAIAANKRAIIETFGSDLTTEESKQNLGFVGQALVGVAASLPSMLTRAIPIVGQVAAFASMANMSYNAINEEMLNDTDFETTSEADRALVAVPYALVMGYLENVGLKNMTAGKSAILGKYMLGQFAKIVPKKLGREALENIVNKEVKSLVGKGVLKVVSGGFAEAETGALQTLVADIGIKKAYNSIRAAYTGEDLKELTGGEAFGTPQSFSEGLMAVGEGALAEAIGGVAMSTVMVGAQGLINGKISLYNEEDLKFFEDFSSDQEFKKLIVSNLKTQMLNGTMTKGEAQSALNDIDLVEGVFNSIDENISDEAKIIAFNLINERNRLEKEVIGKDPALSKEKNDRIKDINDKLGTLPLQVLYTNNIERATELETALKQRNNKAGTVTIDGKKIPRVEAETELKKITQKVEDAIQEQTAGQVPVQPTTAVGEEVVQGEPTTKPQVLTEEGKAEEVVPLTLEEELQLLADEKAKAPVIEAPVEEDNTFVYKINKETTPSGKGKWEDDFEIIDNRDGKSFGEDEAKWVVYNNVSGTSVNALSKKDAQDIIKNAPSYEGLWNEGETINFTELNSKQQENYREEFNRQKAAKVEAPVIETPVVKTEAIPKERVVAYRAEEQAELLKAIPKIERYKVKGKIDKTKMPKTVLAKYNKIYEKYNALISPLLPAVKTKEPAVKAEAPKTQDELPKMRWDDVEEYDDAVIRAMKEIQYRKLKPLRDLGKRTSPTQKEEIKTIQAKIDTADRILKRRADKIKKEAQRVEKEGKGATVRAVDNNGTEAEYSIVVSKDGATAKVQLKKIGTLTPKRASVEANLTIQTDEKRGRFVTTANKTKVYIDEVITPAKVEPTKAKVTPEEKVKAEPVKEVVTPKTTSVKALFESNPELANEVYEALGIKDNVVTKTNKKIDFDKLDKKWSDKILNILKEKYPEVSFEFTENTIQFIDDPMVFMQLSNKMYTEFKRLLTKKRPDLVDRGLIEKSLDDISAFSDEFGTKENKTKLEKLALHWMLNGAVILPEDGPKVVEAEKIASKKKLDAFSYSNPNEIIEKFAEESKKEKVDPDTLSSFTNKKEIGDGIVIYDVDNSDLGQEQARIVLDTHFGEKSNPWCLLYKDADGSLTRAKEHWFKTYPGPKKIAFQNGKLIAFYGGNLWWDRLDNSSDGIPIVRKIKDDSLKRKQLIVVDSNDANKIISYGNKTLGNEQNGEYKEWDKNDNPLFEKNYKDNKANGEWIIYYENGQIEYKENYKDGKQDGQDIGYYNNGQIKYEANYKDGVEDGEFISYDKDGQILNEGNYKDGRRDGKHIGYHDNGQVKYKTNYKYGRREGKEINYYDNGQVKYETNYKDGMKNGQDIGYYGNGQVKYEANYKDGVEDGKYIGYYNDGKVEYYENYKNGRRYGKKINYNENGKAVYEGNYKDGMKNGQDIGYYGNGQVKYEANYKDGVQNGQDIGYYGNGQVKYEANYKDGVEDGKYIGYYNDGKVEYYENYKNGRRYGKKINYNENGKAVYEGNYKDGKRNGKIINYYNNGQILNESNYKDGVQNGKYTGYNIDGWVELVTNYKDGELDGKFIKYNKDGQVESESNYKDGRRDGDWRNFQRNKENEIIGQANTKAMTVLVNALKQKKDTIPHEYAHIYIAMFRDTPIVQEGIKRFGSEEKLVQAIGEQVVQQKGEAYNWWKKFTNFILKIMSDQQVVQVLTDSFLERADLTTYNYTKYSKAQAQDLYSDYIKQNPSGDIDGFREFVFEKQIKPVKEAPAPAKKSTVKEDDLMGAINSIKDEIDEINKAIAKAKKDAKDEIVPIREQIEDLKQAIGKEGTIMDLEDDIAEIEKDLKKELYGVENDTYKGLVGDLKEKVQALKEEVKKIEDLDTKNPENKKTLLSYLDAAIKTLNGLDKLTYAKLDAGVTLGTLKLILQGIRAGVILTGDIKASIKKMAIEYRGKHKNKKITIAEFTKEIEEYLRNTFVDQKTNEQDIQEARAKFVEIREAVRKAKLAVKTESKTLRANAENAIREMLKGKVKNLSAVQMKSIMLRLARFNVFSQTQYDKFINYVDKVIGIADYDSKVNKANENRKNAKKNTIGNKPKLGDITPDLFRSLSIMLNIDAKLIPSDVFESYYDIVDMLSKRDAILELNKRADLNESLDKIIESIESNEQRVSDLKELYDNFADKVVENKVVNYSKTLDKMLEDGVIDKTEHELMKTFKSKIQGAKVKEKMTEQEIADEKAELIDEIKKTTITLDEIVGDEFRLERDLVKKLQILLKNKESLESLNNKELKDLLRIIDNINNGFVSNATQQMVEKLNFIEKSISLEAAIPKTVAGIVKKIRQYITDLTSRDKFRVNIAPLFNIDEQFGDFKTKTIFNAVFEQSAIAQQIYQSEITDIQGELTQVEKAISNIFKNNGNKVILSKFKMMVYMMQLEYNSNPNNKQVHQAMKTLDETIKFAKQNSKKSGYKAADIKQMEFIKEEFGKNDGFEEDGKTIKKIIDIDKLYNSFNEAEKNALKKLQEINNRMTKKATYTASVINGKKIKPIKNYVFYNTISASDRLSTAELINNMSNNMNPTTTSKNLEERDGKVHPVNLNAFYAVNQSARSVLINYHMTEPIRTARKTLSKAMKLLEDNDATTDQYEILTTIGDAYDTATRDLLQSNFTQSNEVMNWLQKTGYRSMLASAPRAISELMSNVSFVMINNPRDMAVGMSEYWTLSTSEDAKDILTILGSKVTSRNYPSDKLSSGLVDLSAITSKLSKNRNIRSREVNGVLQFYDTYLGGWVNGVEFLADNFISQPDKIVMKPLWFGAFARSFQKETGVAPDFDKIKANNEEYMDKYRDALAKAKNNADTQTISAGSSTNAYMGILQNVVREGDKIPAWAKNFNKFMNKFTVQEYYTARKGVNALVGNGDITKAQGAQILAAVTARMTIYVTATRLLSELMLAVFGYAGNDDDDDNDRTMWERIFSVLGFPMTWRDDDEKDDKKTILQRLYQGVASSATTILFGRYFGNFLRLIENSLIEKANEEYGEKIGLRNGEYDPYEDAIQFNQLQDGKIGKTTDLAKVFAGPYAPIIGTVDLGIKLLGPEPKTERAKITRAKEYVRLGLEAGGIAGIIPFYRDVKKVALAEVYKELKKETKETAVKKEAEEIKTALTDNQKISSLRKMRGSGRYTDKEINKAIRIIKDPEYKKAFNDKEKAIKKKILDKYGYDNKEDFKRNDEKNYDIEFGERSNYFKERVESARIASELEKRVNELEKRKK